MADTKTRAETLIDEINGSVIFCTGVLNLIENDECKSNDVCVNAIYAVDKLLCQVSVFAQELDTIIFGLKKAGRLPD